MPIFRRKHRVRDIQELVLVNLLLEPQTSKQQNFRKEFEPQMDDFLEMKAFYWLVFLFKTNS